MAMDLRPSRRLPCQPALKLTLESPEVVQITPAQHRQAVDLFAAMIISYMERNRSAYDSPQPACGFFE